MKKEHEDELVKIYKKTVKELGLHRADKPKKISNKPKKNCWALFRRYYSKEEKIEALKEYFKMTLDGFIEKLEKHEVREFFISITIDGERHHKPGWEWDQDKINEKREKEGDWDGNHTPGWKSDRDKIIGGER